MSDAATNDETSSAELVTPAEVQRICADAAKRMAKAGSRDALAMTLAYAVACSGFMIYLPVDEFRRRVAAALEKALCDVGEWEDLERMARRTARIRAITAAIDAGTYRAPRKRRMARKTPKRKVSK